MADPQVTIQLTTYNRPDLVQRAIKSLQAQTYPHLKILVCDNGSTDETGSVVRKMAESDKRVVYSYYKNNSEGLNNVVSEIKKINTPYFSFLSDDDWLLPNFFEDALKEFEHYPDCGFVALGTRMVDFAGRTIKKPKLNERWAGYYEPPDGAVMMMQGGVLTWTGILFRKELIQYINIWNSICVVNDLSYQLAAALEFPICVSAKEGAICTHHHESFTTITPLHYVWPCYLERVAAVNKYAEQHPGVKDFINNKLMQRFRRRLIWTGIAGLYSRNVETADSVIRIIRENYSFKHIECWILVFFRLLYYINSLTTVSLLKLVINSKTKFVSLIEYIGYLKR